MCDSTMGFDPQNRRKSKKYNFTLDKMLFARKMNVQEVTPSMTDGATALVERVKPTHPY